MKKKIYSGVAVLAVAAMAAWNVNLSSKTGDMSDVSLANVEALAQEVIENKGFVFCSGTDVICTGSGSFKCCR